MSFDLKMHRAKEHRLDQLSSYLKEVVYGGTDGIVTTFAVVSGFAGAGSENMGVPLAAVLLFGFANLFADGVSMGLGNFLSSRSEKDVYAHAKKKEMHEIQVESENEFMETVEILKSKGYSESDANTIAQYYRKNPQYWVYFMMTQELELPNPEHENPFLLSVVTFVSFLFFGFIPLVSYLFYRGDHHFLLSIASTAFALLLLGYIRGRVTTISTVRTVFETLLVGSVASSVAYIVGVFFR